VNQILLACTALLLSGCSSLVTIAAGSDPESFQCDPNYTIPRIYSGVANDLRFLRGPYRDKPMVLFYDSPFSLVADTVFLPYTIFSQATHGNLCEKEP
jgi:uncharacterized protein YceK